MGGDEDNHEEDKPGIEQCSPPQQPLLSCRENVGRASLEVVLRKKLVSYHYEHLSGKP